MMQVDFLRVVEHIEFHLLARLQFSRSRVHLEDLVVQDVLLEGLLRSGFARIGPRLHLDLIVVGHFELPVGLHSADVLQSQRDLPWLGTVFGRDLAKVPVEDGQVANEIVHALIRLVRVVEDLLGVVQRIEQVLVHLGHLEALPEIGDADLVVSNVFESEKRVVALCLDGDECLLNHSFLVALPTRHLVVECLVQVLVQLFLRHADHVDVEFIPQLRFERDADGLLRLGVDDTLGHVEVEVVVEHLGQVGQLLGSVLALALVYLWSHLQFHEDVAAASVEHSG